MDGHSETIKPYAVWAPLTHNSEKVLIRINDAPSLSVFKRHLDNALNNMLQLLVSPEMVRQLD